MKLFQTHNNFVFKIYRHIKNIVIKKQGFTLIESLVALFIQINIVMLIPLIIITLAQIKSALFEDRTYDVEIMLKDMTQIIHADDVRQRKVLKKEIVIQQKNNITTYRFSHHKIIKTINYRGNITMCNQIRDVNYNQTKEGMILMTLKFEEGGHLHVKEILL